MKLDRMFTSNAVFPAGKTLRIYGEGDGCITLNLRMQEVETDTGPQSGIACHKCGVEICVDRDRMTPGQKVAAVKTGDSGSGEIFAEACTQAENGRWMIELPAMQYGGPYELRVQDDCGEAVLTNIYIGEVYLFAGQSNVEFKMQESNTAQELYQENPLLRLYTVDKPGDGEYYASADGWTVCREEEIGKWTALGYLAGYAIAQEKGIAVGIIACYQGASVIESWLPKGAIRETLGTELTIEQKHPDHVHELYGTWNHDGQLYESMLRCAAPYAVSGVFWYQGESDTSVAEGEIYEDELRLLIQIWRKEFQDETLPFVIAGIADYFAPADRAGWKLVQKAQKKVGTTMTGVRFTDAADICETDDIHPPTKTLLAQRIVQAFAEME